MSLHLFQIKHTARIVVLLVIVHLMVVGNLQPVCHEVGTTKTLSFVVQGNIIYTVQLMYPVLLVSTETGHLHTRQVLVTEMFRLPPIEDCLVLLRSHVHQRSYTLLVIRREQAVNVSQLYYGTDGLVLGNGILAKSLFFFRIFLGWISIPKRPLMATSIRYFRGMVRNV